MKQVRVVEAYTTPYPDPLEFEAGETVHVGRRDDEYWGWIWTERKTGQAGWTPESLLGIDPSTSSAVTLERYSARELNTKQDEILAVHRALNGWYWVSNANEETGWIPAKTVVEVAARSS